MISSFLLMQDYLGVGVCIKLWPEGTYALILAARPGGDPSVPKLNWRREGGAALQPHSSPFLQCVSHVGNVSSDRRHSPALILASRYWVPALLMSWCVSCCSNEAALPLVISPERQIDLPRFICYLHLLMGRKNVYISLKKKKKNQSP